MTNISIVYVLAFGICFSSVVNCSWNNEITTMKLETILKEQDLMGYSVTFIVGNMIVYQNGFGLADQESGRKISNDTMYRIASISKSVTTSALMVLFDQGKFQIDQDISTILGFQVRNPNFPDKPITVKQILSHTSSILDGPMYDDFLTTTYNALDPPPISDILVPGGKWYSNTTFSKHFPGSYFQYCNLNFGIAGTLIERLSGIRFDIFVKQNVLEKLGITASFNVADLPDINQLSVLYDHSNNQFVPDYDNYHGVKPQQRNLSSYVIGTNGIIYGPQGGLRISAPQLSRFLRMMYSNGTYFGSRIISSNAVSLMTTPVWQYNGTNGDTMGNFIRAYGLGIHITTNQPDEDTIWPGIIMKGHTGGAYGLESNYFYDPLSGTGFTFAINGCRHNYNSSNTSSFILVEQQIQMVAYDYIYQNIRGNNEVIDEIQ